jgi:hypothetical protein
MSANKNLVAEIVSYVRERNQWRLLPVLVLLLLISPMIRR